MEERGLDGHPDRLPSWDLGELPPLPWREGIDVVMTRIEARLLEHAMAQAGFVKRRAARLLGISRYALDRRIARVERELGAAGAPRPAWVTRDDSEGSSVGRGAGS